MAYRALLEEEKPIESDWNIADDLFIKRVRVDRAGVYLPQHSHKYDHHTFVEGKARLWIDGDLRGDIENAHLIIPAEAKHLFLTLTPCVILCIHNISRTGAVEIAEEHIVEGVE